MTEKEIRHGGEGEIPGENGRGQGGPPGGRGWAAMEEDAAKLARVAEDEGLAALPQRQMIVFSGGGVGRFETEAAAHAQMNSQPAVFGKTKEQLLSVRLGFQQSRAG